LLRERAVDPIDITIYLQALRFWIRRNHQFNRIVDPDLFTMALAEQEWIKLNLMNEQVKAGVTNNDLKLPKLFSGDDWQNFAEHIDTYLNSPKGGSG
jgi:hypothetical protein